MILYFGNTGLAIKGFSNVDFVGDQDDYKFSSSYIFLFGRAAISCCKI